MAPVPDHAVDTKMEDEDGGFGGRSAFLVGGKFDGEIGGDGDGEKGSLKKGPKKRGRPPGGAYGGGGGAGKSPRVAPGPDDIRGPAPRGKRHRTDPRPSDRAAYNRVHKMLDSKYDEWWGFGDAHCVAMHVQAWGASKEAGATVQTLKCDKGRQRFVF